VHALHLLRLLAEEEMLTRLEVPAHLHRNASRVVAAGYEHSGETLINLATRLAGIADLSDIDVLDMGCGVRHTMTIINRGIPIKSYTGVEVNRPIVDFLKEHVEAHDPRFRFFHWDVRNDLYNPEGPSLQSHGALPASDRFDLIWLFSVFTHLDPHDSEVMLRLLRRHIRGNGKLFFSAFIDEELDGFEDRDRVPLVNAYYGRRFMDALIAKCGWKIEYFGVRDPKYFIQHHYLCSPA
jgi:2-polyprenyl-3-methyl-5-hydroxy-6-metoxy-1,4-benzoquinol methylase